MVERFIQTALDDVGELLAVIGDTAAGTAHGKGRPDDDRKADRFLNVAGFLDAVRNIGMRCAQADTCHGLAEQLAILGHIDGLLGSTDKLDAMLFQNAMLVEIQRTVECRLPAHGRQQRVGFFLCDDPFYHFPAHRLDVGGIGHVRIGHDRGRIRVHQDDAKTLFLERLAGLGAGIVELAGLTDNDRAGADDQNGFNIRSLRHWPRISSFVSRISYFPLKRYNEIRFMRYEILANQCSVIFAIPSNR